MHDCDLMINIGARFDDRVTGKVSGFSPDSQKIHLDIDECSINKIIKVDLEIVGDAKDGIKIVARRADFILRAYLPIARHHKMLAVQCLVLLKCR